MLYSKEVLQTVGNHLVNNDSCDFVGLLNFLSLLHLFLTGFERVGVGVGKVDALEESEEGFGFDLPGDNSLLPCLFVLLFLLDLLHGQILVNPLNFRRLGLDGRLLLEFESDRQFLVLDELILSKGEDDGEVVASLFVDHMDFLQMFQQLLIIFSQMFLEHRGSIETFPPVSLNFLGSELFGDLLYFFFVEVFVEIFEFVLLDIPLPGDDVGNLSGGTVTLLRMGSSCLRYFFSISRVAFSISY